MVNYKPFLLVVTILKIKCRPIFKKEHYCCSLKPFSWGFADIPGSGSRFFWLVQTEFSSNPSSLLVYTDFGLISNHVLLFRAFFCCWKALLKLDANQFSSIFLVSNSGSNYSGQCKQIFYRMFSFRRVEQALSLKTFFPNSNPGFQQQKNSSDQKHQT